MDYIDYEAEIEARDVLIQQKDELLHALANKVDELGEVILQSNNVIAETSASLEATRAKAEEDALAANAIIAALQGQIVELEDQLRSNREDIGTTIAALSNELKNARAAAAQELAKVKEEADLRQEAVDKEWQSLLLKATEREDDLKREILLLKAGKHEEKVDFHRILSSSVTDGQKQSEELKQVFITAQKNAEERALAAEARAEELRLALGNAVADIERAREAARVGIEEVHSLAVNDAKQKEMVLKLSVEEVENAFEERHRRDLGALQLAHEREIAEHVKARQEAIDKAAVAEASLKAAVARHTEELVEVGATIEAQQAVFESQLAELSERCNAAIGESVAALEGALARAKLEHREEVSGLQSALKKAQERQKEFSSSSVGGSKALMPSAATLARAGTLPALSSSASASSGAGGRRSSVSSDSGNPAQPRRSSLTTMSSGAILSAAAAAASAAAAPSAASSATASPSKPTLLAAAVSSNPSFSSSANSAIGLSSADGRKDGVLSPIGETGEDDGGDSPGPSRPSSTLPVPGEASAGSAALERLKDSYERRLESQRGAHEREMAALRREMENLASLVASSPSSSSFSSLPAPSAGLGPMQSTPPKIPGPPPLPPPPSSSSSTPPDSGKEAAAKIGARIARASLAAAGIPLPPSNPQSQGTLASIKENEAVTAETASVRARMPRASRASMAVASLTDLAGGGAALASSRNARASTVGLAALGQAHSAAALGQLQAELETMRMQRDSAVATRDEMDKEKEAAEQKLASIEADKARLESELAAAKSQLAAAHGDAKAAKDMAATAEQQAAKARSLNDSAVLAAKAHAERLEVQLAEAQEEASRASAELQRTQAALALARDEADEAYDQVEELREQIKNTSAERMLAFTELSSEQKNAIDSMKDGFREQIEAIKHASDTKLEITISALRHAHEAEIESRDARIDAMEDEIDQHKEELQRMRGDERRLQSETAAAKRQVEAIQHKLKDQTEELKEARDACERLASELADFLGEETTEAIKEGKGNSTSTTEETLSGVASKRVAEINRELDEAHVSKARTEAELRRVKEYYEQTLAALTDSHTREVQALQTALRESRASAASSASAAAASAGVGFGGAVLPITAPLILSSPQPHPLSARGRAGALLGLTLDLPYQNSNNSNSNNSHSARSLSSPASSSSRAGHAAVAAASQEEVTGPVADGMALLGLRPTTPSNSHSNSRSTSASPASRGPAASRQPGGGAAAAGAFVKPTPRRVAGGDGSSSSSSSSSSGAATEGIASLQKELALLGLAADSDEPKSSFSSSSNNGGSNIFATLFDSINFPSALAASADNASGAAEGDGPVESWQQSLLRRMQALEMALARVALDAGAPVVSAGSDGDAAADDEDEEDKQKKKQQQQQQQEQEQNSTPSKKQREDEWTDDDEAARNLPRLAESGAAPNAKAYLSSPSQAGDNNNSSSNKKKEEREKQATAARHKKQQENWRRKFRRVFIRVGRIAEALAARLQQTRTKEQDRLKKQATDVTRSLTAAQLERAREIERLEAALVHAKRAEAMSQGGGGGAHSISSANVSANSSPIPGRTAASSPSYTAVSPGSFSYASQGPPMLAGGSYHPALSSAQLTETIAKLKAAHAADIEALKQQQQVLESSLSSVRLELESRKEEVLASQIKAQEEREGWEAERGEMEEEIDRLHEAARKQLEASRETEAKAQQVVSEVHEKAREEASETIRKALDRQELEIERLKQAHEGEVKFLQDRVATLTQELDEVRKRLLQQLQMHHAEMKQTLEQKQQEHDEALRRAVERSEAALQATHSEEVERLRKSHAAEIEGLKTAQAHKIALILHDAERSEMASRSTFDQQAVYLQQSLKETTLALKTVEVKAEELTRRCADLDKKLAVETARRVAAERELGTARADASREVDRRELIQSTATRTETDLRRQIAAAKEEASAASARGKAIERQLEAILAERVKLANSSSNNGAAAPSASVLAPVAALEKEEIGRLRGRVSDLTAHVAELQAHLAAAQSQLQVSRDEAAEAIASSQGLRLQLAVLEEELFRTREREENLAKASGLVGSLKAQSAVELAKMKQKLQQQQQQQQQQLLQYEHEQEQATVGGEQDGERATVQPPQGRFDTLDGLASPSSPAGPPSASLLLQFTEPFSSAAVPRLDISHASLQPSYAGQLANSRGAAAMAAAEDASLAAAHASASFKPAFPQKGSPSPPPVPAGPPSAAASLRALSSNMLAQVAAANGGNMPGSGGAPSEAELRAVAAAVPVSLQAVMRERARAHSAGGSKQQRR